ncbi:MAG: phosphate ABC transporter substrate-binding protein PstS family protein [Candidatus Goldiibacteriota bacterium]
MKKFTKITVLLAVFSMLVSGAVMAWEWPWNKKDENKISTQGSTTVLPIVQKAAEVFMNANPDIEVSVRGGGSGVGIAAIMDGTVDIGMASRDIKEKEILSAKKKGVNVVGTVIARDGMAVVVHPSNPIKAITVAQLKKIYSGEVKNWKELGGKDDAIVCMSRDSSSGTFAVFNGIVLGKEKLRTDAVMTVSNREVAENVKNTSGAIGYVGLAFVSDALKVLPLNGVMPSDSSVGSGTYKLARGLNLYTDGEPSGLAGKFVDFIMSSQGQKIVKEVGYTAVK